MTDLIGNGLTTNDLTSSYNLLDEPWIPVETLDGIGRKVGLRELFERADELRDFAVAPAQRIALTRLVLCVAQAALDGPNDADELSELYENERLTLKSTAVEYLEKWRDRFDLFGEKPFLQARNITRTLNAKTDKLDFALAAGANSSLLDQGATPNGRAHSPDWLALQLLTFQMYSPGGLIGTTVWNGATTSKSSSDAPAGEGSMLHGFLLGDALLDSIWLNTICRENLDGVLWGKPIWERDLNGPTSDKDVVSSYLGRLVPFARCVLLETNGRDMTLADGLTYPKLGEGVRNPFGALMARNKPKPGEYSDYYLRTDAEKAPWRNLSAILVRSENRNQRGLFALKNLDDLDAEEDSTFKLWVGGVAFDKAKILDALSWSFSIKNSMLQSAKLQRYENGVKDAEFWETRLGFAVKTYCDALGRGDSASDAAAQAKKTYWSALDSLSGVLLDAANSGNDDEWKRTLRSVVSATFEQYCPRETPRQIGAYALGRRTLFQIYAKNKQKNGKTKK